MISIKNPYARITASVHIVLVHPLYPGNVGSTARAMKNMGYKKLVLIAKKDPRCFPEAFWMAKGAGEKRRYPCRWVD